MRVIAGSAKGCKLTSTPGLHTRPTADRIKETIFNILTPYLYEANVLDLFSGTGALGIEALSRGASYAALVEWDRQSTAVIAKNLKAARLMEKAEIMEMDASLALQRLGKKIEKEPIKEGRQFDLVFLDPPYGQGQIQIALEGILAQDLLSDTGIIVAEQGGDEETVAIAPLEAYRVKQYKTIKLVFYRMQEDF